MNAEMGSKRFRVEERSGIVAIYDTHHTDYLSLLHVPGCHADDPWVVCSWRGAYNEDNRHWEVAQKWIDRAHSACNLLNDLHSRAQAREGAI